MGQGITADLISKKKAMYDVDMNVLPGGKLVLQFVEKKMLSICKSNLKLLKRFPILSQKHT